MIGSEDVHNGRLVESAREVFSLRRVIHVSDGAYEYLGENCRGSRIFISQTPEAPQSLEIYLPVSLVHLSTIMDSTKTFTRGRRG